VGLGALRERRAVDGLVAVLASPHESLRGVAAEALGRIGDPRAMAPLITALQDKNEGVRSSAADALAALEDPRGTEALLEGLSKGRAKKQALAALQKLAGTSLGGDPLLWRKWWEENGKKRALQINEGASVPPSAPK
jgi:HEAT repeat protein